MRNFPPPSSSRLNSNRVVSAEIIKPRLTTAGRSATVTTAPKKQQLSCNKTWNNGDEENVVNGSSQKITESKTTDPLKPSLAARRGLSDRRSSSENPTERSKSVTRSKSVSRSWVRGNTVTNISTKMEAERDGDINLTRKSEVRKTSYTNIERDSTANANIEYNTRENSEEVEYCTSGIRQLPSDTTSVISNCSSDLSFCASEASVMRHSMEDTHHVHIRNPSPVPPKIVNHNLCMSHVTKTPVARRIIEDGVECSNEGYASVSKLAQWLAEKPFDQKKVAPSAAGVPSSVPRPARVAHSTPMVATASRVKPMDYKTPASSSVHHLNVRKQLFHDKNQDCNVPSAKVGGINAVQLKPVIPPTKDKPKQPAPAGSAVGLAPKYSYPRTMNRVQKDEVMATNEGYAPVQKLSKWLEDRPFEKKKEVTAPRKGAKILEKSLIFEPNQPIPKSYTVHKEIADHDNVKVPEKKTWLEGAFKSTNNNNTEGHKGDDGSIENDLSMVHVSEKAKWLQEEAFKKKNVRYQK